VCVGFVQEVRVEKEGIERKIDDLAQDAAGQLSTVTLLRIVRLQLGPHTPCGIQCLCSPVYLLRDLIQKHAVTQSHTRLERIANLWAMLTYKTANDTVIFLFSN